MNGRNGRFDGRIAIVGIGCRFPGGANDPEAFWRLLESGEDPIGRMPEGRFAVDRFVDPRPGTPGKMVTAEGGFLEEIDLFDAAFFGISPREARKMDPQHRLLMEVAWEALEDAGIPPSSLAGKRVGVFAGVWSSEYESVMYRTPTELDFHSITGGGRYAASGRISFALDLRGPAVTVDTGCSASLVALHLARQAIEDGECELAIAAAANLVLQPHVNVGYSRSGMLSAGARCRFGDADAAGYVRSDGVGAVVLKPLDRAVADRDPVRGVVLATGVNADGRGSGQLATPSAEAQAEMLSFVYGRADVDPASVPYVEAHGTGTRAGDPVELEALGQVLGRGRAADRPLVVGSVKSVIGHTEAAAGMAGLIKALLVMEHRRIPANLHLRSPNETIDWDGLRVRVPTEPVDWPAGAPLVAGVSSFGITGTNAHAVVAAVDEAGKESRAGALVNGRIAGMAAGAGAASVAGNEGVAPAVIAISGRTDAALREAAENLRQWLASEGHSARLADIAYTATARREHHERRLALVATSAADLLGALDDHLGPNANGRAITGETTTKPRIAFVFSGQGSQWAGMGRELLSTAPAFASTLRRCDEEVRRLAGWSVLDTLLIDGPALLERVEAIQPTLTCVQIALVEQMREWGIVPDAVVGHSMGEVAAAYSAGALTLEDAMRVIVTRSGLLARIAGKGAMALVDLPEDELARLLADAGGAVSVASVNGPRSTVMSGDADLVDALLAKLDLEGVFCRRVRVDVASHSPQTDPLLDPLRDALATLDPRTPEVAFYSTARPDAATDARLDPSYWVDNLRQPVQLMAAVSRMVADGVDTFVEIAPHPVLLSSLADIAAEPRASIRTMAGPRREEPEMRRMLDLLARLHVAGVDVNWSALAAPGARVVHLPSYPWQRERHWLESWQDWSGTDSSVRVTAPRPERTDELAYAIAWRPYQPEVVSAEGQRWIVIGDPEGLGTVLTARMREAGAHADLVPDEQALEGAHQAGVVDLRAIGARGADPASFEAAMLRGFTQATGTVRALLDRRASPPLGTWLVTRGAQAPAERRAEVGAAPQGAVWGVARTSAAEQPELRLSAIDLDPTMDMPGNASALWSLLSAGGTEDQIALADGAAFVARLTRAAPDDTRTPVQWRHDAAYLVTGGLGDLGLLVAEEMVRTGARRLILSGRTAVPERAEWSSLPADASVRERLDRVRAMEREGASIHLASFDVGVAGELDRFLAGYEAEGWPPIAGVVHCAGVFDAGPSSVDGFYRSAAGKSLGAFNLHRALPELDVLVLFSSISSVIPQPNVQYAAANAVLDSIAAARVGSGLPAVSLSWGAWAEAGMTLEAPVERYLQVMRSQGIADLPAEIATGLFTWSSAAGAAHLLLGDIDWSIASERVAAGGNRPLFAEVAESAAVAGSDELLMELRALPREKRLEALANRVRGTLAEVLQLPATVVSATIPFGKQGLDSLMGVEFRNRLEMALGTRLPASLAWNYPTIGVLAEHLATLIGDSGDERGSNPTSEPASVAADHTPVAALLAELQMESEEEILRQLRGEGV